MVSYGILWYLMVSSCIIWHYWVSYGVIRYIECLMMRFSDPIPESDFPIIDSFVIASSVSSIISYHIRVQHEKIILIKNFVLSYYKCHHFISFSVETKIKRTKKNIFCNKLPCHDGALLPIHLQFLFFIESIFKCRNFGKKKKM
jgi:hypothetical protein